MLKKNTINVRIKFGLFDRLWRKNWVATTQSEKRNRYRIYLECEDKEHYNLIESVEFIPCKPYTNCSVQRTSAPYCLCFSSLQIKSAKIVIKWNTIDKFVNESYKYPHLSSFNKEASIVEVN